MLIVLVCLGKTINMTSDNIAINSNNFSVDKNGNITATGGNIAGFVLQSTNFSKAIQGLYDYNMYDLFMSAGHIMNWINLDGSLYNICDINNDGNLKSDDWRLTRKYILGDRTYTKPIQGNFNINSNNPKNCISVFQDGELAVSIGVGGVNTNMLTTKNILCGTISDTLGSSTGIAINGPQAIISCIYEGQTKTTISNDEIRTPVVIQTSKAEEKKNFEEYKNALETLKNIDIYKYNFKNEEDGSKKHIGFVIGDNYNYSEEVTSTNNDGADIYSFVSLCCKAIQEQQAQIEELQKEIKELKGGK